MLLFSQRLKLQNLYLQWCERNQVADTPFSVITFLYGNDLINEEKAHLYLEEHKDEVQMS
jgi:hypothetical protein